MSDGTEIATAAEMRWLMEQAARDGIMLHVSEEPDVYQKDGECYYYYTALSVNAGKERVRQFVDTYSLLPICALNKMIDDISEPSVVENIKQIRRILQARDRRRLVRRRKEEREMAKLEEEIRIEVERQEATANCNNLDWLIDRIESLGWEVLLRRKPKEDSNNIKE